MEFDELEDCATAPKLYYDALSSHGRSCRMLIQLLKINVDLQSTDSMDDINSNESYTWLNSYCKLPTLVDSGVTLCNGHSIMIYLCQKYAPQSLTHLCPCDNITRQKITSMLFYECCVLYRCLSHLLTDILLAKFPNVDVEYHRRKVSKVYNSLNTFVRGQSFMIGNYLTIADICMVSSVSALNIIFPIDYGKFPKLFDWFHRLKKMQFYVINYEGIQKLSYMLKNIGKFPFPSPLTIETEYTGYESDKGYNARKRSDEKSKRNINVGEVSNKNNDRSSKTKANSSEEEEYDFLNDNIHQNLAHHSAIGNNEGVDEIICLCSCSKEFCKSQESNLIKRRLKRTKKFNRESPATSNKEKEKKYASSTASGSEDTNDEYPKAHQLEEHQHCKICACNSEQIRKGIYKDKVNMDQLKETEIVVEDEIRNDITMAPRPDEKTKVDSITSTTDDYSGVVNQEIQELVEKVRKLERILEMSDKVLNNGSATSSPKTSDNLPILKKFPHKCGIPSCSCHECDCYEKSEITGNVCRGGSRIAALDFDEISHVVMPEFLIRNVENETESSDTNQTEKQKQDRLKAGSNCNQCKVKSFRVDFPNACARLKPKSEDFENRLSHKRGKNLKTIYFFCTKSSCKIKNKSCCNDCCQKEKVINSKIPRLVSQKSLVNLTK